MRLAYLLASTLLATAACASDTTVEGELPFEGDADGLAKADGATVSFTELDGVNVSSDRLQKGGTVILTSKTAWKKVMGTEAPKEINFAKEWVAFYGTGVKNTGGFGAQISSVTYHAGVGALVLETKATSPGNDCLVTQAITMPHTVVKFKIPSPLPTFALVAHEDNVKRCSPTNAENLEALADSRVAWDDAKAKHGSSYTYTRDFHSFFGNFGYQTTLVVANGVVVERHFKKQSFNSGSDSTQWTETGAEVGSHDEGHPAVTVDALYDECKNDVLTQDENQNWINFSTDANQFLQRCTYVPMGCQDDCSRGPTISTLKF